MPHGRIMALDLGKARTGVALTDPLGYTVQPLMTITNKGGGEDLRNILRLIRNNAVTAVVVGNPLHMSGEVSPWARKVQTFAEVLRTRAGIPVHLWDERLSSVAANELLAAAGRGTHDRKQVLDQVAAVVILQDWLQAQEYAAARAALLASDAAQP